MHFQDFPKSQQGQDAVVNILGDNEGIISHLLWIDPIAAGSILLTDNLVALKRENYDIILTVKRT